MRALRLLAFLFLLMALAGAASAARIEGDGYPALFGTREVFSPDSSAFFKWHGMLARFAVEERTEPACAPRAAEPCRPAEWRALLASLQGLDLRAKIERVNAAINRHPYVPSFVNWHESNHWETPFEFLRKGGQCQDYAIAKYLLLRASGVPAAKLRLVVLRDTHLGLDHAVTVAFLDGEALVLDNQRRDIVPASRLDYYRPYYSINEQGWWLHRGAGARYASAE
jgi:predicted transglutaminase-like cysteine proteinase